MKWIIILKVNLTTSYNENTNVKNVTIRHQNGLKVFINLVFILQILSIMRIGHEKNLHVVHHLYYRNLVNMTFWHSMYPVTEVLTKTQANPFAFATTFSMHTSQNLSHKFTLKSWSLQELAQHSSSASPHEVRCKNVRR